MLADFETTHINFFSPQLLTSNPINNTSTIFPCLCLQQCILNFFSLLFNNIFVFLGFNCNGFSFTSRNYTSICVLRLWLWILHIPIGFPFAARDT
jgi:hypothetical protein